MGVELSAIMIDKKDNVGTMLDEIKEGETVLIKGNNEKIMAKNNISFGHKIALTDINKEEKIIKYGEIIGKANRNIKKGEHVHVHNVDCIRGTKETK